MTPRNRRPDYITRTEAKAMIAKAVEAERARYEQQNAGLMLSIGVYVQALNLIDDAFSEIAGQLDRHEAFINVLEAAVGPVLRSTVEAETPQDETAPS